MSAAPPLATIPVGVVVERSKAASQWLDYHWGPSAVLTGVPDTPLWTKLSDDGERATFYAGPAEIELHRTETENYRANLATGEPLLWVVLRRTESEPPYKVFAVLADPAEGEAMTEAGNDLVDSVAMPEAVEDAVAAFVAEHHVERQFVKRKRDRANREALAKREGERG
jgi:uncharacterized protein DUF3305